MELVRDHRLSVAVRSWLHSDLDTRLDTLRDIVEVLKTSEHEPLWTVSQLSAKQMTVIRWLRKCKVAPNVYSIPFLSPMFCDMIRRETVDWSFEGNPSEPEHLRCPEAVLHDVCPQLHRVVCELFRSALTPVYQLIHGAVPEYISAAQLTRYTMDRNSNGGWHQDDDSDYTAVVELAPELHTGGGTDVMSAPLAVTSVPTLAKGHALLFCGKTTHHRGRPITEGVRDLLVYWTETKR